MGDRSNIATHTLDADLVIRALEAVRRASESYGIPTGSLKPCIAWHLDGEAGATPRETAFTLATELRGLGFSESETEAHLKRWASRAGFPAREAARTVKSAFRRDADGGFKYSRPGLKNAAGGVYDRTLGWICAALGCPSNCPAYAGKYAGDHSQTFTRFLQMGWASWLKRRRWNRAVDVYSAICRREKQIGLAPGTELWTSYKQISALADGTNAKTVGAALKQLASVGLVEFTPGSGSGPHAKDRVGTHLRRIVPIPPVPTEPSHPSSSAYKSGSGTPSHIGGATPSRSSR